MGPDRRLIYADASALVKLAVEEPESEALERHLDPALVQTATNRIAVVEVSRAVRLANPTEEGHATADQVLARCMLLSMTTPLLRQARSLASADLPTLDAIHLASAIHLEVDELVAYDRRLLAAARTAGLAVQSPA